MIPKLYLRPLNYRDITFSHKSCLPHFPGPLVLADDAVVGEDGEDEDMTVEEDEEEDGADEDVMLPPDGEQVSIELLYI